MCVCVCVLVVVMVVIRKGRISSQQKGVELEDEEEKGEEDDFRVC